MADASTPASKDPVYRRRQKALEQRLRWDPLLDEAYRYAVPQYPSPMINAPRDKDATRGEKRGAKIYDSTAAVAIDERAAMTVGALFPAGSRWLLPDPDIEVKELAEYANHAFETCQRAFDDSNFDTEIYLAMRDAYVSTGGITLHKGTWEQPFRFEAIPVGTLVPEEAPDQVIRTNFRARKVEVAQIPVLWPGAELPKEYEAKVTSSPMEEVELCEGDVFDPLRNSTYYGVWIEAGWKRILWLEHQVGRNIIFRTDKAPDETMGRGSVISVLADIRTADKIVELILKNASIAVTGMWQADDDGVLNPATIKLQPGIIIPKAQDSKGLQPLTSGMDFNVSDLILGDLQAGIRRAIKGPDLPPADEGVRTAFEIGERRADQDAVEWPRLQRVQRELYVPLLRRALWTLMDPSFAGSDYEIKPFEGMSRIETVDMLLRALETPSDRLKKENDARIGYSAVGAAVSVFGEAATSPQVLKAADFIRDFYADAGVKPEYIPDEEEQRQAAEAEQQQQQQAQALEIAREAMNSGAAGNA